MSTLKHIECSFCAESGACLSYLNYWACLDKCKQIITEILESEIKKPRDS